MFNDAPNVAKIASRATGWTAAGYVGAAVFTTVNAPAAATFLGTQTLLTNLDAKILPEFCNDSNFGYGVTFVVNGILAYQITHIVGLPLTIAGVFTATAVGTAVIVSALVVIYLAKKWCCPTSFGIGTHNFFDTMGYFFQPKITLPLRIYSSALLNEINSRNDEPDQTHVHHAHGQAPLTTSLLEESIELQLESVLAIGGKIPGSGIRITVESKVYEGTYYEDFSRKSLILSKIGTDEILAIHIHKDTLTLVHNEEELPETTLPESFVKPWKALCQQLENR